MKSGDISTKTLPVKLFKICLGVLCARRLKSLWDTLLEKFKEVFKQKVF